MLDFYSPRLWDTYIPNLGQSLGKCRNLVDIQSEKVFNDIEALLCGKLGKLVLKAHEVRHDRSFQQQLSLNATTRRLW
jgi:hypothetical protein